MRNAFKYWSRLTRFALLGQLPATWEDVPIWAPTLPFSNWNKAWKPNGKTFEQSQTKGLSPLMRRLLPTRLLYLLFLYIWPIIVAFRALKRQGGFGLYWRGALQNPELALLHPQSTYTKTEWFNSRPDYALGMYYSVLWAAKEPSYLRLEHKDIFMKMADKHGIPTPKNLSIEEAEKHGGPIYVKDPQGDLGFGISVVDASELQEYEDASEMLLQFPLKNHPTLLEIFPPDAPLSTLRVTTLLDPTTGEHDIARCALRMGRSGAVSDNTAQGGIWANIDKTTGKIKSGVTKNTFCMYQNRTKLRISMHPDCKSSFEGKKVPHWEEGRKLALLAQKRLAPTALSMGWDIALCEGEPVLLEVNVWTVVYDYDPPDDAFSPALKLILEGLHNLKSEQGENYKI